MYILNSVFHIFTIHCCYSLFNFYCMIYDLHVLYNLFYPLLYTYHSILRFTQYSESQLVSGLHKCRKLIEVFRLLRITKLYAMQFAVPYDLRNRCPLIEPNLVWRRVSLRLRLQLWIVRQMWFKAVPSAWTTRECVALSIDSFGLLSDRHSHSSIHSFILIHSFTHYVCYSYYCCCCYCWCGPDLVRSLDTTIAS